MHMFLAAAVGLIGGIGLGYLFFYATQRRRQEPDRVAQLEDELLRYRSQVNAHFGKTSALFQDMTQQYRELYDHLAKGAEALCEPTAASRDINFEELDLIQHDPQAAESTDPAVPTRSNGDGRDTDQPPRHSDAS